MSKQALKTRLSVILSLVGEILWRSFGLFLKYLPAGFVIGLGLVVATDNFWTLALGVFSAFIPALLEAYAEIGEEIARTAKATRTGISRGFNKAVRIIEAKEQELKEKK